MINDEDNGKDEYDLHVHVAQDYISTHPYTVFSSTPDMISRKSQGRSIKKGHLRGFPDIALFDPRINVRKVGRKLHIDICPGLFWELKNPNPNIGGTSPHQKIVLQALVNRGYMSFVSRDRREVREQIQNYEENWHPLYKGTIVINLDRGNVKLPGKPYHQPVLPRKRQKKKKKKKKKKTRKRRKTTTVKRRRKTLTGKKRKRKTKTTKRKRRKLSV